MFVSVDGELTKTCESTTWTITISPGAADPGMSILSGDMITGSVAGETSTLTVTMCDTYGNPLDSGDFEVELNSSVCDGLDLTRACLDLEEVLLTL